MSYTNTTLTQAIKDYTENDETTFTTNIPNFIKNAEERILKLVELDYFRKNGKSHKYESKCRKELKVQTLDVCLGDFPAQVKKIF